MSAPVAHCLAVSARELEVLRYPGPVAMSVFGDRYRQGDLLILTTEAGAGPFVRRIEVVEVGNPIEGCTRLTLALLALPAPTPAGPALPLGSPETLPERLPRGIAPPLSHWTGDPATCRCYDCSKARDGAWKVASRFINCPICGNKRCPKATNHAHACTGSNDEGQPGSLYGGRGETP